MGKSEMMAILLRFLVSMHNNPVSVVLITVNLAGSVVMLAIL